MKGGKDVTPEMWRAAQTYLHNAQRLDRANAYPCFEEAGILFQYAPYAMTGPSARRNLTPAEREANRTPVRNATVRKDGRRAVDMMFRGSSLPRCVTPRYADSVPSLLFAVWQYAQFSFGDFHSGARLRELARGGIGYGRFMAEFDNSSDEGIRACRAVITMGKRLTGDWSLPENGRSGEGRTIVYVGNMVSTVGYRTLLQVYVIINDTIAANATQAEYDDLQKRYADFRAAENAKFGTGVASYY